MELKLMTGDRVPDFQLINLDGQLIKSIEMRGKVSIINFWSAECGVSSRVDDHLRNYLAMWGDRVTLFTIATNPHETVEVIRQAAYERCLSQVLLDSDHVAMELFGAITTPHLFVLDGQGKLCYQGAFDDITFRNRTAKRYHLKEAVEAILAGRAVELPATPAYGCAIVRLNPNTGSAAPIDEST